MFFGKEAAFLDKGALLETLLALFAVASTLGASTLGASILGASILGETELSVFQSSLCTFWVAVLVLRKLAKFFRWPNMFL